MFEQLKEILVEDMQIKEELIKPEAELVNDLGMNSIELSELVLACEEKFNVEIDEERAKDFLTISDVVAYMDEIAG
ncbi:MAG: acyl carrier protein [Clostridia bacterium]|nr:acyl carrier protein [Clostridia bacterium]